MKKTPLILTLLGSILFGLLSYFGFSPDPGLSSDVVAYSDQAAAAIAAKNWIALGTVLITAIATGYVWWKNRSGGGGTGFGVLAILFLAMVSMRFSQLPRTPKSLPNYTYKSPGTDMKITVISPLPRFLPRLC